MRNHNPAIAWKVDYKVTPSAVGAFGVHWTWCYSNDGYARVKIPETWNFQLPQEPGFSRDHFGASETRGLLGGVASGRLKKLSEQCERAIGDVLTYALCQVIDCIGLSDDPEVITILGPALPKMAGRFCSLRLPESARIVWICPVPFPRWITSRGDELLLIPQRHLTMTDQSGLRAGAESWEQESLVGGFTWTRQGSAAQYVVQYLCNPGDLDAVQELTPWLNKLPGVLDVFEDKVWLPREIVAAAGQVDVHFKERYRGEQEEDIRFHDPTFAPAVFDSAAKCRSDKELLTWNALWKHE